MGGGSGKLYILFKVVKMKFLRFSDMSYHPGDRSVDDP